MHCAGRNRAAASKFSFPEVQYAILFVLIGIQLNFRAALINVDQANSVKENVHDNLNRQLKTLTYFLSFIQTLSISNQSIKSIVCNFIISDFCCDKSHL
jgi:hypothetical protein